MTPADFLTAFADALARPKVEYIPAGLTLRFLVPTDRLSEPLAVCDPVGLIWWARTGHAARVRLLNSLEYATALGLDSTTALYLLDAIDGVRLETSRVYLWRTALERELDVHFRPSGARKPA